MLLVILARWVNEEQRMVIRYLEEENRAVIKGSAIVRLGALQNPPQVRFCATERLGGMLNHYYRDAA